MNMLLVDDKLSDRKSLCCACDQAGLDCTFFEADCVGSALEVLEKKEIQCVLMGYALPGENGLEGVGQIHQRYPYVPVIIVTGSQDGLLASRAFQCGAADFFPKEQLTQVPWREVVERAVTRANDQKEFDEIQAYRSRFASMLAHDLVSPVGHILNFVELARDHLREENYDILDEILNYIDKSTHNLHDLIAAISAYAGSGQKVELSPVRLNDAVDAALDMFEDKISASGAELLVEDLPVINGNIGLLSQLFLNLISNAIKFNRARFPVICIASARKEDCFRISVRDNGVGIPDDRMCDIFEPFTRGHDRREFAGTGLGLATVSRVVKHHMGIISAANNPDGGAVFCIEFPAPAGNKTH